MNTGWLSKASLFLSLMLHSALAGFIVYSTVNNWFPNGTTESNGVVDIQVVNKSEGAPVVSPKAQPALPEFQKKASEPAEAEASKKESDDKASPVIVKSKPKKVAVKAKAKAKPASLPVKKTISKPEDTKSLIDSTEEILSQKEAPQEIEPDVSELGPIPAPEGELSDENKAGELTETEDPSEKHDEQASNAAPLPPVISDTIPERAQARTDVRQGETVPRFGTPGSIIAESLLVPLPGNRNPQYSFIARLKKMEGTVVIRAYITKDGLVNQPKLEKSSGYAPLDQEAVDSFAKWRFKPNHNTGAWLVKSFIFRLRN